MSFKLYDETVGTNNVSTLSPAYIGRRFSIQPTGPFQGKASIEGIAEEAPKIRYNTEWGSGPTAVFAEKVKEFMDHPIIKTFGSANGEYKPVIATDSWTQKYPVKGTILEVPLKFRSYPLVMYNTSDYFSVIKNLMLYTAPGKFMFSDGLKVINNAIDTAANLGWSAGDSLKTLNSAVKSLHRANETIPWSEIASNVAAALSLKTGTNKVQADSLDSVLKTIDAQYEDQMGTNTGRSTSEIVKAISSLIYVLDHVTEPDGAGCQTFKLQYGTMFKDAYTKWVISSWSFKPAVNTTIISKNEKEIICPIYVDINLTMRTAGQLGTGDICNIINMS